MKKIQKLVQEMRALLEGGGTEATAHAVAEEYAQLCRQAEARLETVMVMLDKHNDYQALQAAEQSPALLDFIGALSFGLELDWQNYCTRHALASAPRFDARAVQRLMGIYQNPITAKHPLYKDFRTAMLERDDVKALRIVRTILKLNPDDATAQRERKRLENKKLQQVVDELKACLEQGREDELTDLLEELESMADPDKLARVDVYEQARAVSIARLKEAGLRRLPQLLEQMAQQRQKGDWRAVGHSLEQWQELARQAQGIEPGAEQSRLAEFAAYHQKEVAAHQAEQRFETVRKSFIVFVEEMETRLLTSTGFSLEEVRGLDEAFVRRWKELESYGKPVAVDQLRRIQAVGVGLRGRVEAMERGRRMRFGALASAGVAALIALAAVGWHAWKAFGMSSALQDYRTQAQCLPAESLLKNIRAEEPLLLKWPFLRRSTEECEAWLKQAREAEATVLADLEALSTGLNAKPGLEESGRLVAKFEQVEKAVGALAKDLSPPHRTKMEALRLQRDLHLATLQKDQVTTVLKQITDIEARIEKELSFNQPVAAATDLLKSLDEQLQPLEELAKVTTTGLELSGDVKLRISAQRKKLEEFQKEVDAHAAAKTELEKAVTLAELTKALQAWQKLRFAEAVPAIKAVDAMPTEKTFMAQILTGGDERALQAVMEDASRGSMMPESPTDSDLEAIIELRDDVFLNDVYELQVLDHTKGGRRRTLWSQGQLIAAGFTGNTQLWKGKCYDPDLVSGTVYFPPTTLVTGSRGGGGIELLSARLCSTSEMMNTLKISSMTDENGKHFQMTVLDVMDKLVRNETASPLAKAYVMVKLYDFAKVRSYAWGLHLCPTLESDITELDALLDKVFVSAEDWLSKESQQKYSSKLAPFFAGLKTRTYLKEAKARRELLAAVASAGLKFGGHVDAGLTLQISTAARTANELWYLRQDGKPGMVPTPASPAEKITASSAQPFSPVFYIPVDRRAMVEKFQENLKSVSEAQSRLPAAESYFITPP